MSTAEQALGGPEIEVVAKATRRRFTLEYKRKIVREADACKTPGAVGALLRREGLYSSHLATWRAARERGELVGAARRSAAPCRGSPIRATSGSPSWSGAHAVEAARRAGRGAGRSPKKNGGVAGDAAGHRALLMATVTEVGPRLGIAPTCAALGLPRATYYRRRRPPRAPPPRRPSPRALRAEEQAAVLAVLHEPRFVDLAPAEVYATLLDEGRYLCSERTMYRLLAAHEEVRERRNQLRHPRYAAPELLARRPNELWSWDITKLLGPAKWTYFYLYVMLDVFSRYVVGWMVAHRESATLAERLISETCARQGIGRGQLTDPRRPRLGDDVQARRAAAGRPGRDQDACPAARLQRQPVLGGAVQDAQVPAGLPGAVRLDPGCPRLLPRLLPLVQRRAPSQRPRPADACTTCTTAWPSSAWRRGRPCSPPPTRRTQNGSPAASPSRRRVPRRCGSIRPRPQRQRRRPAPYS